MGQYVSPANDKYVKFYIFRIQLRKPNIQMIEYFPSHVTLIFMDLHAGRICLPVTLLLTQFFSQHCAVLDFNW